MSGFNTGAVIQPTEECGSRPTLADNCGLTGILDAGTLLLTDQLVLCRNGVMLKTTMADLLARVGSGGANPDTNEDTTGAGGRVLWDDGFALLWDDNSHIIFG